MIFKTEKGNLSTARSQYLGSWTEDDCNVDLYVAHPKRKTVYYIVISGEKNQGSVVSGNTQNAEPFTAKILSHTEAKKCAEKCPKTSLAYEMFFGEELELMAS